MTTLPESGLTPHYITPGPGESTGQMAEMYEQNKRLNGHAALPALLVGDPGLTPVARQPVLFSPTVAATTAGSEDFSPIVIAPIATGNFTGVSSANPGWFFGGDLIFATGTTAGDGLGLTQVIGWLAEADHRSSAALTGSFIGLWAEAAFEGAGSNTGTIGNMVSLKVAAPKRKDGNTGGTVTGTVYGIYLDGVNPASTGAPAGHTIFVADAGDIYVSGMSTLGAGATIADVGHIYFGTADLTVDAGGIVHNNHGFASTDPIQSTAFCNIGDFDHRVMWGTGSPEGIVFAKRGSLFLRTDGSTSTTLYVKTSGDFETGWTAK